MTETLRNITLVIVLMLIFSCGQENDLAGYWREYIDDSSDTYYTYFVSDSTIKRDFPLYDWEVKLDFEGNRFYIPFGINHEWSLDYVVNGDTILIDDNHRWIRYEYCDSIFLQDLSSLLMVNVIPPKIDSLNDYKNYDKKNSAYINIGMIKDSWKYYIDFHEINNYNGFYIQLNDAFADINDIPEFCVKMDNIVLHLDYRVSNDFIDEVCELIQRGHSLPKIFRSYVDLESRQLLIRQIR